MSQADTLTYEIDAKIRYDVIADGLTHPDTTIWGMPAWAGNQSSGSMDLVIDGAGNVSGSASVMGSRSIGLTNLTFGLTDGAWGAPVANVAPLTAATVHLKDSFLGEITGMNTVVSGFIKDGNSGDFFNLSNGIGQDGKLEFTVSGPSGMSLAVTYKGLSGAGTGEYQLMLDGGELSYVNGTTTASVGIIGVVMHSAWLDRTAQTFNIPDALNVMHPGHMWWWYYQWPRSIDSFSGNIDATGNFVGSAHFSGIDFTSLSGSTTSGTFSDGNSAGFDLGNGLEIGDTFTTVLTDSTGQFDLVINGTLIPEPSSFVLAAIAFLGLFAHAWQKRPWR